MPASPPGRVLLIVLDSVGCGAAADAAAYGDEGTDTLGNISRKLGGLTLPYLQKYGIGNLTTILGVPPAARPAGCYGKMQEASAGKDTTTGHWEMAGLRIDEAFTTFPEGFPETILAPFRERTGRGVLGNKPASGTVILDELGEEHMRTGALIVYTSGDSVFQVAAHEAVVPLEELYRACQIAREILDAHRVGRVIARPFVGDGPGSFRRTYNRKDFSMVPPQATVLDAIAARGLPVVGVGKIEDIYAGRGITEGVHTEGNADGLEKTVELLGRVERGLIFVNLVDFDMLYGHRNDPAGYYKCLREFDEFMPRLEAALRPGDLVLLTADHGNDPTTVSTDHTREYVPILGFGPACRAGVDLGVRRTFADVGATLAEAFGVTPPTHGESFLGQIRGLMPPLVQELIRRKRDGERVAPDDLRWFVAAVTDGSVPDYQAAAMLMAIYFRGLDEDELAAWADAMLRSGDVLDLAGVDLPKVDKHSTGGVGDKISLPLAPAAAACGIAVPMVSGRGLGHTGGTLDKLEAIPGFRVDLPVEQFTAIVRKLGVCLTGQTARIAPADRKLYALRDVTATVESIPLIASSIMSKKLAEGIDGLVLDCKVGSGAFMKTLDRARALARTIQQIGRSAGKRVTALLTDMSQPIGRFVGNAVEVAESIEVLRGRGPADTRALTIALGAEMLVIGGVAADAQEGSAKIARALDDGSALEKWRQVVEAQGGDPRVCDTPETVLPQVPGRRDVVAPRGGTLAAVDAQAVGTAVVVLGGGRRKTEDKVDAAVGVEVLARIGDRIERGQPLARIHHRGDPAEAEARLAAAFVLDDRPHAAPPLVHETLR